ncbi:MAG: 3TM-type holin [Desulfatiglandales bacterium]
MSIFSKLIGGGAKALVTSIGGVLDDLITSGEEKAAAKNKLAKLVLNYQLEMEAVAVREVEAQRDVLIAELNQGDNFTKRARPCIIYAGLGITIVNYCIAPLAAFFLGKELPLIVVPDVFWAGWSGVCGLYVWSRGKEKQGARNKIIQAITGSKL